MARNFKRECARHSICFCIVHCIAYTWRLFIIKIESVQPEANAKQNRITLNCAQREEIAVWMAEYSLHFVICL